MIIGLLLAVATSVLAAVRPGRAVSKVPVVAALSERVEPPQVVARSLRPGLLFLVAGLVLLFFSGGWNGGADNTRYLILIGLICCEIASALLAPFLVDRLARFAWRAPLATRLAIRDLERYRSRSGAAMAAISFAVFLATIAIVIASVRFDDALDYTAPNMAANQLILYAPGNDPAQYQTGQFTPAAKLAATRAGAAALAAQLHAPAPLELDVPVSVNVAAPGQPDPERERRRRRDRPGPVRRADVRGHPATAGGLRDQPGLAEPAGRRAHRARRAAVDRGPGADQRRVPRRGRGTSPARPGCAS